MYWGQDIRMVDCITNPRCVRPEDFTPHPDPSIGHKVENLSKEDYGKIPLWKIFTTSYVNTCGTHWLEFELIADSGERGRTTSVGPDRTHGTTGASGRNHTHTTLLAKIGSSREYRQAISV
jgi:hypothetical protein